MELLYGACYENLKWSNLLSSEHDEKFSSASAFKNASRKLRYKKNLVLEQQMKSSPLFSPFAA